jgi:hypothetical protein
MLPPHDTIINFFFFTKQKITNQVNGLRFDFLCFFFLKKKKEKEKEKSIVISLGDNIISL